MVTEVNKIIFNALVGGRGVYLPEVGTLYIERQAARKISNTKLLSPRNVVAFSSQEQAASLVREIETIASCSESQAADIYERWLKQTRVENTLIIDGIGVLVDKSFRMEEEFAATINPQGVKTLVLRKKSSHWWIYLIAILCALLSLGAVGYYFFFDGFTWSEQTELLEEDAVEDVASYGYASESVALAEPETTTTIAEAPAAEVATQTVGVVTNQKSSSKGSSTQAEAAVDVAKAQGGEFQYAYYVVCGIYADSNNVPRAISQVKRAIAGVECTIFPYRNKSMITVFGSDDRAECQQYINSHNSQLSGLWIYKAK
jgi:hypothetical protein